MFALITVVHIIVALILIIVVLLQTGKRADLAGAFGGGGSQENIPTTEMAASESDPSAVSGYLDEIFKAATRSSGSVRLTATTRSTNSTLPTCCGEPRLNGWPAAS